MKKLVQESDECTCILWTLNYKRKRKNEYWEDRKKNIKISLQKELLRSWLHE